ncbi:TRAP transporter permease [Alkalihalobacillus deserti]|uniref:TRAP transporter permease n=1 Tax=Alkalihalobacillus deserti TaxID=2879466 RepID=UPI001D13D9E7|nr:TRAP transporter fused permease subunit [Alkalihalobacillus deserti]
MEKNNEEISKFRKFMGWQAFLWGLLLVLIPLSGILFILSFFDYFGISIMKQQYAAWFMGLVLSAVFIGVPATIRSSKTVIPWYDWCMSILGFCGGLYIVIFYPAILYQFGVITPLRLFFSGIVILLILEALRRMFGLSLVIIVAVFLSYGFVAPYMPGAFKGQGTSYDQLLNYLYLDANSLLDLLYLAATMAFAFILFGQTLLNLKGGDIFNDLAVRMFGRFRGGPAKASVVGSGAVGSITGNPVANVLLTGSMTIPLMKRSGYSSSQSAAIESVASTGGTITPPIMGIAAFMMAENLGVSYQVIVIAAIVPAFLYYLSLFIQVDLKAGQNNIRKVPEKDLPDKASVLKKTWLIVPIFFFLVYFLFAQGLPPATAGVYASGIAVIVLCLQKQIRQEFLPRMISILTDTGKTMLEIGVILAAAGLIVGVIAITGLGFNLVQVITSFGQHGLFVLLIASAVVCIILGMGMPAVAAYAIVAVLVVPALVELGVEAIAAHFFVFFFATMSNITPPIALACFAAAPIAKESPHKIGFEATKLGIIGYIIPFVFVYNSSILLSSSQDANITSVLLSILLAIFAVSSLSVAVAGFLFENLNWIKRLLLILSAVLILIPGTLGMGWGGDLAGCVIASIVFTLEYLRRKTYKQALLVEKEVQIS